MITPEQSSVAVAVPVLAGSVESLQFNVTPAGHEITGGVVSSKVNVCTQVATLPQLSSAVHVLEMISGHDPLLVPLHVIVTPEQSSVAVAIPVDDGKVEALQSSVLFGGQVITGGVVSSIVIICTQVATLPQLSSAVHVLVRISGQEPLRTSL